MLKRSLGAVMLKNNKIILFIVLFATGFLFSCTIDDSEFFGGTSSSGITIPDGLTAEQKAEYVLSNMTMDEKIGQMVQVSKGCLTGKESDITTYYIGSVLSGGGETPSVNTPVNWLLMVSNFQSYAMKTRLKIPLLYGVDAVHGHNNVYGAVIFPHNIGIGAAKDTNLAYQIARITAEEMNGTGIRWTFAPCVAVPRDERWGRTYEGFGEDPQLCSDLGSAMILGFQGSALSNSDSVMATAKHYVGDGGTTAGVNEGDTVCNEATLRSIHLLPYLAAVSNGVGTVMPSFSSWNGTNMHGNSFLISNVLKTELGFSGFVISDWDGHLHLPGTYAQQVSNAINSGVDMFMLGGATYVTLINTIKSLISSGAVTSARIDDAVRRILRMKFLLGLFDQPYPSGIYTSGVGSAAHRLVAREAVRKSVVVLKNSNNSVLPISTNVARVHVAGTFANNIGAQCGGWTITWQGSLGAITPGTTILQGISNTVSAGTTVTYSSDGTGASGATIGIVVIGESPYAESYGDNADLSISSSNRQTISNVANAGVPVVVVLLSGRPMIVTPQLPGWNAFAAAWLPGTEGQGIADILFGLYSPTGTLPCCWPSDMSQVPINTGDGKTPLYPYGFGLTY